MIFGISGQDGAYLAELLLRKGVEVHGTSRDKESARFPSPRALDCRLRAPGRVELDQMPTLPDLRRAARSLFDSKNRSTAAV